MTAVDLAEADDLSRGILTPSLEPALAERALTLLPEDGMARKLFASIVGSFSLLYTLVSISMQFCTAMARDLPV